MKKYLFLPLLLIYFADLAAISSPVDYVNILMGTDSKYELSAGNTYPAIALPWGMNFWMPQTGKMGDGWAYTYSANQIRGFKQTHQPSPWINDYGQFSLMPTTGKLTVDETERASWFSHKAETATPYHYKVYLADYDIRAEFTPTERCAHFRIEYPATDSANFIVDAFDRGSFVKVLPEEQKIIGYTTRNSGGVPDNFRNYFVIEFDTPFAEIALFDKTTRKPGNELTADHAIAAVRFDTRTKRTVEARVSSSFISFEQAEVSLRKELGKASFDAIYTYARATWDYVLCKILITDHSNIDRLRTFYSCLYRSLLFPRRLYEIDANGKIKHYSPFNGKICDGYLFSDTGFWDTFRSLFPLLNLVYPSMAAQMQEGLLNTLLESGFFPEWASPGHRDCMVGNNSASVVASAYLMGIDTKQPKQMFEGLLHGANAVHPSVKSTGRLGFEHYNRLGYVPYDCGINESAARTLEYAYNDWCIWQMGKSMGRPASEIAIYKQRASNYKKLFDPSSKLMRGRNADGSFQSPFNPLKWGDAFTEGNSWHYTWSVFHDVQGLIDLMGGEGEFVSMLDSVFKLPPVFDNSYYGFTIHEIREMQICDMGNYAHGNQPIQHMIYLYNHARAPYKAQYWLREVMNRLYTPTPDGYCGDEDNGQTSAWYVFSALGFYPVCPASGEYVLGAPYFSSALIHLENGKTITISAPANSDKNRYIGSLQFNKKPYTKNYLRHADLLLGPSLKFEMSPKPNLRRGTSDADRPYSMSIE